MEDVADKTPVRVAGIVSSVTPKMTRKGDRMVFFNIEDRYGEIECLAFPSQYEKLSHLIRVEAPLYVEGAMSSRDGDEDKPKIIVNSLTELVENNRFEEIGASSLPKPQKEESRVQRTAPQQKEQKPITRVFLRVPDMSCEVYLKAKNIVDIFDGNTSVVFYDSASASYKSYSAGIDASAFVLSELRDILGNENVVAK